MTVKKEAILITGAAGDFQNVIKTIHLERGNVEAAFERAFRVVEGEYAVGHQEQMYIEPQGMLAT
ncbi:MAG: hypothetical protein D6780_02790, partial [Candidatus Dadabacteria bacterium]